MSDSAVEKLRIVFAGTPEFAARHLQTLIDHHMTLVGVYTQPDRPAGRGKKLQPSSVKKIAVAHQLPLFQPLNFKNDESLEQLAALQADLMIVVAYGLILPKAVLETPKFGCINVHASLLPRWRGAAPIQRAIQAGDSETGITIMQMDAGLDTGDMLSKLVCPLTSRETAASLHDRLIPLGQDALLDTVARIAARDTTPEKQDDSLANYAHKIEKAEAQINWQNPALDIDRCIRAFNPFPVCFSQLQDRRIKIHQAFVLEQHSQADAGEILRVSDQGIDVQTGKGALRIERLQMPGKKALPAADALRGYPELFCQGMKFQNGEDL